MNERRPLITAIALASVVACSGGTFGDPIDGGDTADVGVDTDRDAPEMDRRARIGEECVGPRDCVDDALCIGTRDDRFGCMAICDGDYELCDDGSVCLPVTSRDAAICYTGGDIGARQTCSNNLDCAPGLLCFGVSSDFYCREACADHQACDEAEYCQKLGSGAGLCRDAVGADCSTTACQPGLSCSLEDAEISSLFPGGYCTMDCGDDPDCPTSTACRRLPGTERDVCLALCEHDSDCRFNGDYHCLDQNTCTQSADPAGCRLLFGDDSLCVPGAF